MSNKSTTDNARRWRRTTVTALLAFLLLPALALATGAGQRRATLKMGHAPRLQAVPTIAGKPRTSDKKVVLEKADRLFKNDLDPYMVVVGQVHFSKGPMQMYCDSAHYYPDDSSFDAFGNVRMEQGDTLFVYADELNFNGPGEIAYLFGPDPERPVRMINRDVTLKTDIFTYDLASELGYYNTGGELTDRNNRLTSLEGEYLPATKDANFYVDVHLHSLRPNDTLDIYTDSLFYNTVSHIASFKSPTTIVNNDGVITSTDGVYNTDSGEGELFRHSSVRTNGGTVLEGDTLIYDRNTGIGEAFGNMSLTDSVKQSKLSGDYGYYDEKIDSAYVTGRALAMEYSQGDTLYMHGRYITSVLRVDTIRTEKKIKVPAPAAADTLAADTLAADSLAADTALAGRLTPDTPDKRALTSDLQKPGLSTADSLTADSLPLPPIEEKFIEKVTVTETVDSTHIVTAWPRVRFYRTDMQGLCDSMVFVQRDSCLHMLRHPIVWNENQQIFGNTIIVHVNDSTVDRAVLPDFAFIAQEIEPDFYNQLTGKKMNAFFVGGKIDRLEVDGSVQAIFFPEESDSTINKMVDVESSFLNAWFKDGNVERMKMWPASNGNVTPLYLARRSQLLLPKFKWYAPLRPESPQDVFVVPKEMEELMQQSAQ